MYSLATDQRDESTCPECLALLLWSWGHGLINKSETFLGEVKAIRLQLRTPSADLRRISARLDNIERIARELVELPSPFQLEQVSVNQLITKRVEELREREPYNVANFQVDLDLNEPVVKANSVWLRRLFDILIDNAIDAMRGSTKKRIDVCTSINERQVKIAVSDTGKGIDTQLLLNFFGKPPTLQSGGRGRGIFIAQIIADIYSGRIMVDTTGPVGTTIAVCFPLRQQARR